MLELLCWLVAVVLAAPMALFVLECLASLLYRPRQIPDSRCRCTVLIPAHNEEAGIRATLDSINPQLEEGDRILVVADNCSDATADLVREAGCEVSERFHDTDRGKGFALAHGLDQMRADPPDVVLVVDADCDLRPGSFKRLKQAAVHLKKPVQSSYLLQAPEGVSVKTRVSEFAVLLKNRVRCRGLTTLGAGVPLLGSGMAFPWSTIANASLASGEIVEDMKLGVDLACAGKGAVYLDEAEVLSLLPTTPEALAKQRERWEHGHLGVIQRFAPSLLMESLKKLSPTLFLFMLDLVIPPLSLLIMSTLALFMLFAVLSLFISIQPILWLVSILSVSVVACVLSVWAILGRRVLTVADLMYLPVYVLSKLGLYKGFVTDKQTSWNRTDRG